MGALTPTKEVNISERELYQNTSYKFQRMTFKEIMIFFRVIIQKICLQDEL